jgi:hypothetical protein
MTGADPFEVCGNNVQAIDLSFDQIALHKIALISITPLIVAHKHRGRFDYWGQRLPFIYTYKHTLRLNHIYQRSGNESSFVSFLESQILACWASVT